ncbi:TonB-dependent receptor [Gimibacter soli]|uniref:TonB-dependent receptor n=1 Tax=Gimibacter soli TaxID=3024400 RepID=A0AAE9XLA1_9PROT|nr:TonB-dependent receptor [Gimibacter soli]WCL53254.1 TonB-dependent receptor [Gimibacter soli]
MRKLGSSLLVLCTYGLSQQAVAQTEDQSDDFALEEIVVTARGQREILRETPATLTVLTAETLEKTGIKNASDFVNFTPGVSIVANTAEAGDNQINIRGINSARDAESSVALVVDGILKTNTAVLNQDQGTVRQIEILKGPQGAIYGRNAAAGAIVMTTAEPGDEMEGGFKASGGNNSNFSGAAYISAPLSDTVGFLVSADYTTTDGFFRNRYLGDRAIVDDRETWNINGRLVLKPSDVTKIDAKLRYGELGGASINFNPIFALPTFASGLGVPAFYEDINKHTFLYDSNIRPENDQRTFEASVKLEHEFDTMRLTAWALYSDVKNDLTADGTSGDFFRYAGVAECIASTAEAEGYPVNPPSYFAGAFGQLYGAYSPTTCDGTQYQMRNQKDFSAEVRLASLDDGQPLQWQLGSYYLNIDRTTAVSLGADLNQGVLQNPYNGPTSANPTSQLYWDNFNTNVYAGFGSLSYAMSEALKGTFALRYDREERKVHNLAPAVFDPYTGGPINPGQQVVDGVVQPIADQSEAFDQIEPKISLSYAPDRTFTAFANWGIGFKSGGFNNQGSKALIDANFNSAPVNAGVVINDQFRKETSSAFEAGIKGTFLDGRVSYDLAGYYTKVDDMQFFEFFVGGFGLLRVVSNIDRVDIKGLETNVNVRITPEWRVFGGVNITDSEIKENASRPNTVGNKSPYTPDYTINAGTQYVQEITDDIDLFVRADWRRVGPTWFHTVQDQTRVTIFEAFYPGLGTANYDLTQRKAYDLVNLRIGFETDTWSLTGYASNLFNEKFVEEVIPAVEFGGSFVSPGARRSYGLELSYKF